VPFDIGLSELLVIFAVVLIVVGPERVPELARNVGRTIGDIRRTVNELTRDFTGEMTEPPRPMPPMAVCVVCGGLNPVDGKYCSYCGTDMRPSPPPLPPPPSAEH
jgi:Tat protein translocase TatB subunit